MKVSDGKEKHFLVEVENDGAGEIEEHHLPGHQDYVEEGKMAQQHQYSIDKKGKKNEIPVTHQMMQDKFELLSTGHL